MRYSRFLAPTLRDDPADAEVISHRLLLRAGYIRRVTSGVYDFLPMGLRVLRKIEQVVREEMNRAGAQELLLPMVQPAELWEKSNRWEKYCPELLRFTDRHNHESCLGPTRFVAGATSAGHSACSPRTTSTRRPPPACFAFQRVGFARWEFVGRC